METIRAFIAVDIGEEIREKLDQLQRKLKKVHANVRWVKPQNIHLTLAFLGDIPIEKLDPLKTALDKGVQEMAPFELKAFSCGFFGRPKHPRVVWAGIADCPPLMELQCKTIEALQCLKIEPDNNPFSPHLTLGRVKSTDQHTEPLLGKLEKYKEEPLGQTRIDAVQLIQSQLKPHGAEYSVLGSSSLYG
ncbi:MAG: RNA 2',3'-cyclic phosphodiesterase [Verrucomicrobiota bacterium]